MSDLIGQTLGNYEILSLLGEGGMANVYRARQTNIQRYVAIKVIKSGLTNVEQFAQRFEREVQTIAALNHPHIIKVFDYGKQGDLVYLVMEFQPGGSLADLIGAGPLPLPRASQLLAQIASALDYAHRQGVVHRDLKPQNILLDADGNAILTDFGIAKIFQADSALTQSGMLVGTPTYMSPEQWQGRPVDSRADIYALGIVLFEMLSGQLPFTADTPFGIMHKHVYDQPPSVIAFRPEVSFAVDQVIKQALAKDRDQRFATASEFAQAFKAALSGQGPSPLLTSQAGAGGTAPKLPTPVLVGSSTSGTLSSPDKAGGGRGPLLLVVALVALVLITGVIGLSNRTPVPAAVAFVPLATAAPSLTVIAVAPLVTALPSATTISASATNTPSATVAPSATVPSSATPPPTATTIPASASSAVPTLDVRQTLGAQRTAQQASANGQNTSIASTLQGISALQTQFTQVAQQTATSLAATRNAQASAAAITLTATPLPATATILAPTIVPTTAPTVSTPVPAVGSVIFGDKAKDGHVNTLVITLNNIPLAGEGKQYEAWLSDRQHSPFTLGKLIVKADKTVQLSYADPKGANLLITYSAVLITVQGKDLNPPGPVVFSGAIPPEANVHIQHVTSRFPDTPGNTGLLNGAVQEEGALTEHLNLLNDSLKQGNALLAKLHLEHLYNIMNGKEGAKDINADGRVTVAPPGDGFGLFNYLTNAVEHADLAAQQPDATEAIKTSAENVMTTAANASTSLTQMQALVLDAASKKTAADMKPLIAQMLTLNGVILNGKPDASGKVTPTQGSGGLLMAYSEGVAMATIPLVPGDAAAQPVSVTPESTANPHPTTTPSPIPTAFSVNPATETVITMKDLDFVAKTLTVKAGTVIVFDNQSEREHTATAEDATFDTGVVAPGERSKPIKLTKPGVYPYYCQFHGGPGGVGMSGTITVQ